jgi:pyruvate-formate lyase-activating enzyme
VSTLAIMVTRRCNMACAHCSVESGPKAGGRGPALEDLLASVRDAAAAGVQSIIVTGGEPMLRERAVLEMVRECCSRGLGCRVVTNGFWGRTAERAERTLDALLDAGLSYLTVSYDRFHAAFQGPEPVVHIAAAAERRGFRVDVNVTRMADDDEIEALVAPFADFPSIRFRYYDVQPVGHARELPGTELRAELEGFCSACSIPALTDDGRLTACNGPSYFQPADSPLVVGTLRDAPLGALLERHAGDPILDTIRTSGPAGLRDALRGIPEFASFPFRERYNGICDLCHHVTSSPDAVAALRIALAAPRKAAARAARARLIGRAHIDGVLSRSYINEAGAAKAFLAIAAGAEIGPEESGRVLGRADFDWHAQAGALAGAGLAGLVLDRVEEPALARWAPRLFASRLRRAAVADAAREMAAREALRRLGEELRARRAAGTVIGGGACAFLALGDGGGSAARSPASFEVVASGGPRLAGGRAAIAVRRSIGQGPWGLPEAMLEGARPVPGLEGLRCLDPSAALVSVMVAAAARGLRGGLEAGWDAGVALRAGVDAERVLALVRAMRAPRAFWVPLRALADRVALPVPERILDQAPDDARQRRLEALAAARLFAHGPGSPMANTLFGWAWPALAAGTRAGFGRQLPATAMRAARDLPRAWREAGSGGMSGAFREARRVVEAWNAVTR